MIRLLKAIIDFFRFQSYLGESYPVRELPSERSKTIRDHRVSLYCFLLKLGLRPNELRAKFWLAILKMDGEIR